MIWRTASRPGLNLMADTPSRSGTRPAAVQPDARLARLVDDLCDTDPEEPAAPPAGGLAFLEPPRRPGDLGALGPYRVLAELGRGGMGIVLKAHDDVLQR